MPHVGPRQCRRIVHTVPDKGDTPLFRQGGDEPDLVAGQEIGMDLPLLQTEIAADAFGDGAAVPRHHHQPADARGPQCLQAIVG